MKLVTFERILLLPCTFILSGQVSKKSDIELRLIKSGHFLEKGRLREKGQLLHTFHQTGSAVREYFLLILICSF